MPQLYDEIGKGYRSYRQPDPRIASQIQRALGDAASVLNVGAGTGSYEPRDRPVVAVEPSVEMIRQRSVDGAPVVRASAAHLPFPADAFDAALAILTVHHWPDRGPALTEFARVARRRAVILTFDPAATGFWLIDDYFPEIAAIDRRMLPTIDELHQTLGGVEVHRLPTPHDCTDGFLGAYWRRPHAYLDPGIRGAISAFSIIPNVTTGLERLRCDLEDGTWDSRYGHLAGLSEIDLGYRLVVASFGDRASRGRSATPLA